VKRPPLWLMLALAALGLFAVLRVRASDPAPIPRAAIALSKGQRPLPRKNDEETALSPPPPEPVHAKAGLPGAQAKPNPFGPPRWAPRNAEEWQGMLVNLNITPPCFQAQSAAWRVPAAMVYVWPAIRINIALLGRCA
jgi:hypothetical protein